MSSKFNAINLFELNNSFMLSQLTNVNLRHDLKHPSPELIV